MEVSNPSFYKRPRDSRPHDHQDYYQPAKQHPFIGPNGVIKTSASGPAGDASTVKDSDFIEIIPGETEVPAAEFSVGSFVELCCPICQSPMTAKLISTSKNSEQEVTKQEYSVTDKPCDCPFIVLECLPFRGGIKW